MYKWFYSNFYTFMYEQSVSSFQGFSITCCGQKNWLIKERIGEIHYTNIMNRDSKKSHKSRKMWFLANSVIFAKGHDFPCWDVIHPCTQWMWVQLIWVMVVAGRIASQCCSHRPLKTAGYLGRHVQALEQRSQHCYSRMLIHTDIHNFHKSRPWFLPWFSIVPNN